MQAILGSLDSKINYYNCFQGLNSVICKTIFLDPSYSKFWGVHWSQFHVDIIHVLHIIWSPFGLYMDKREIPVRKCYHQKTMPWPWKNISFLTMKMAPKKQIILFRTRQLSLSHESYWVFWVWMTMVEMHAQICRRSFINSNEGPCLQIHISLFNGAHRQGKPHKMKS